MKKFETIVGEEANGRRLDQFLSEFLDVSRNQAQHSIEAKKVQINGKAAKKNGVKLATGDKITGVVFLPSLDLEPEDLPLDIIAETKDYLVINKDPGMVVHPDESGHSKGTLLNAILGHTSLSDGTSEERPGIVHRLDKDTSGVMIVAKNNKIHEKLGKAFHDREVDKIYLALVLGKMKSPTGRIDAPLRRSTKNRTQMAIHHQGKNAVTLFEVLEEYEGTSLLKVKIETGRTHQIRVHLASIGHPIVGDSVYGDEKFNHEFYKKFDLNRQFLHANELSILGQHFVGELKKDLLEVLNQLRSL